MRTRGIAAALAMASLSMAAFSSQPMVETTARPVNDSEVKRVRKAVSRGTLAKPRRSKNAPTKRKLRTNHAHTSKRVRRKHRRAA